MNPQTPEKMNKLVMKLLAEDPAERGENAQTAVEELARLQDSLPSAGVELGLRSAVTDPRSALESE